MSNEKASNYDHLLEAYMKAFKDHYKPSSLNKPDLKSAGHHITNDEFTIPTQTGGTTSIMPSVSAPSIGQLQKKARTQKAKGLLFAGSTWGESLILQVINLIQSKEEAEQYSGPLPVFARPCPVVPRHGFVDSRVISTTSELIALWEEMVKVEENGEIMLTPVHKPRWNLLWTPTLITFGKGHDGATAGHDTINLPIAWDGKMPDTFTKNKKLAIADGQWPYVEMIQGKASPSSVINSLIMTQIRSGPPLANAIGDFIPKKMKVKSVLTAKGDLVEWETAIQNAPHGTVIHNPGGSPTDHYSVHCMQENVPVLYGDNPPEIDSWLSPKPIEEPDLDAVRNGIIVGATIPLGVDGAMRRAAYLMIYGLHHSVALKGPHAFWVGVGASLFCRLGILALKGEARHYYSSESNAVHRSEVYRHNRNRSIHSLRRAVPKLLTLFAFGRWAGSMGGKKWAQCGLATRDLLNAIRRFVREPSTFNYSNLMKKYNVGINQAHNGGWWMNKFVSQDVFDAFLSPSPTLWASLTPIVFEVRSHHREMSPEMFNKEVETIQKWPITRYHKTERQQVKINLPRARTRFRTRVSGDESRSPFNALGLNVSGFSKEKALTKLIPDIEATSWVDDNGVLVIEANDTVIYESGPLEVQE